MDLNNSVIVATRYVTFENRRVDGENRQYRVTRDWELSRIGDDSEGYFIAGSPYQVLGTFDHPFSVERLLEAQSVLPTRYVDLSSPAAGAWNGLIHWKHPTI